MKEIYLKLRLIEKIENFEMLKKELIEVIHNIEKAEYIVVDMPFNEVNSLNIVQDDEGEVVVTNLIQAIEILKECQQGKLLKI